jgi:hypothetical protein
VAAPQHSNLVFDGLVVDPCRRRGDKGFNWFKMGKLARSCMAVLSMYGYTDRRTTYGASLGSSFRPFRLCQGFLANPALISLSRSMVWCGRTTQSKRLSSCPFNSEVATYFPYFTAQHFGFGGDTGPHQSGGLQLQMISLLAVHREGKRRIRIRYSVDLIRS